MGPGRGGTNRKNKHNSVIVRNKTNKKQKHTMMMGNESTQRKTDETIGTMVRCLARPDPWGPRKGIKNVGPREGKNKQKQNQTNMEIAVVFTKDRKHEPTQRKRHEKWSGLLPWARGPMDLVK